MAALFKQLTVKAGSAKLDLSCEVDSLTVDEASAQAAMLTARVTDSYKVLGHALREGLTVEARIGSDDDHSLIFRGRIHKVEGSYDAGRPGTLTVHAHDRCMRMGLKARNRGLAGLSLSDAIRKVARDAFGDKVDVTLASDPAFGHNGVRQAEATDLDFLRDLAEEFGCELGVVWQKDDDRLEFVSRATLMAREPIVTAWFGRQDVAPVLERFEASVDVAGIELPVRVSGIDADSGEHIEVTDGAPPAEIDLEDRFFEDNFGSYSDAHPGKADALMAVIDAAGGVAEGLREELGGFARAAEAIPTNKARLEARRDNHHSLRSRGMSGRGTVAGLKQLRPRQTIELLDVGGRFVGKWYLDKVTHRVEGNVYSTEFEVTR